MANEYTEAPSVLQNQDIPIAPTPVSSEVPLPQEPTVPDISSIMSSVDQSDNLLGLEMPQIPPNEVSSLLGTAEDHHPEPLQSSNMPQSSILPQHNNISQNSNMPQMENMGYDHVIIFNLLQVNSIRNILNVLIK